MNTIWVMRARAGQNKRLHLKLKSIKLPAIRGTGAISKTEQRKINQKKRIEQAQLEEEEKRKRITVSEYFDYYYYINSQVHKAKNTIAAEKFLYKKWLKPVLGNIPFINITPYHLEQIKVNMLTENKAVSTITYAFFVISQKWTLAKRDELVFTDSPTKKGAFTQTGQCPSTLSERGRSKTFIGRTPFSF